MSIFLFSMYDYWLLRFFLFLSLTYCYAPNTRSNSFYLTPDSDSSTPTLLHVSSRVILRTSKHISVTVNSPAGFSFAFQRWKDHSSEFPPNSDINRHPNPFRLRVRTDWACVQVMSKMMKYSTDTGLKRSFLMQSLMGFPYVVSSCHLNSIRPAKWGEVSPFHKHLPLEFRLQREGFKSPRVPDKITCKSLAEGQR